MISKKVSVVLTDLSNRIDYYQWFLYGFMLMEKAGKIDLKYRTSVIQRISLSAVLWPLAKVINKLRFLIMNKRKKYFPKSKSLLRGYVEKDGKKIFFCIDSADAPFLFSGKDLEERDVYFKMQCPKEMNDEGFYMGNVCIPWVDYEYVEGIDKHSLRGERKKCPEVIIHRKKIKPLLVAIRSMGRSNSFKALDTAYKNLLAARDVPHTGKAMCYFGNARGPKPSGCKENPDYDWEADILSVYGDRMNHPNEKRAKIAAILESLGDGYDARIIERGFSDEEKKERRSLEIPFKDFSRHVAKYVYNINVSGYRMSIPGRFMDSFVGGTAIATDNLSVKWYRPFGKEVVEVGAMGYLPDEEVDYAAIKEKISNLPPVSKQSVIDKYEECWAPMKCAEYIVEVVRRKDKVLHPGRKINRYAE